MVKCVMVEKYANRKDNGNRTIGLSTLSFVTNWNKLYDAVFVFLIEILLYDLDGIGHNIA